MLIVEPGAFRTNLFGKGAAHFSQEHPAYAEKVGATRKLVQGGDGTQAGDPAKAAAAIRLALDADNTPLRLARGGDTVDSLVGHLDAVGRTRHVGDGLPGNGLRHAVTGGRSTGPSAVTAGQPVPRPGG